MPVIIIVGGQWGDEGKGKVVDQLAEDAAMVVRFSGGDNAGHTVINPYGEFKLHLVPSGIFHPEAVCVIGNGAVINPACMIEEIEGLNRSGVATDGLVISDRAHLVMPYHLLLDKLEEESRAGKALGTTLRGIGPAFTDKVARMGIRAGDLLDKTAFYERLSFVMEYKNSILTRVYGAKKLSLDEIYHQFCQYAERLKPYIKNATVLIQQAMARDDYILLEGAQGALLDPDIGTYPYATSSSPLSSGGCLGTGIPPTRIDRVLGVFKAYCTRVGSGPMPTELIDDVGNAIRERAHEYGTTTGRPRRCGWFDAVAARFSSQVNGLTGVAITRLDVLDELPQLKVCVGYKLDGKVIDYFPASAADLQKCQPIYQEVPGWQADTSSARRFDELPVKARDYVNRLEELITAPIDIVCVGPAREQTINVRPVL
jgi:adenylosuccinate synthase